MRVHPGLTLVPLALCLALSAPATAGEWRGYPGAYGGHVAYGSGYGFADGAVSGAYVGAPFAPFPRPTALVPPAWSYGTYGVPTATGIRQAPVGEPRVYVVQPAGRSPSRPLGHSMGSAPPRDAYAGPVAEDAPPDGPRILTVRVPRR